MPSLKTVRDGLVNLVANLGTDRDKASHGAYVLRTMTDQQLSAAYRSSWLPRKIVDVVANDACRVWREWQATAEQITKITTLENRLNVRGKVIEAMKKARLFGGACIYIGTNETELTKPLKITEAIQHLTVIPRTHITAGETDIEPTSKYFGLPGYYTIANSHERIHPSRLVVFYGGKLPDELNDVTVAYRGWGDSVLLPVLDALLNADSTVANVASLVFEAKVDVLKIPDFMANLDDPDYERRIISRASLAARAKGINGMLMIDAEEDYQQKSASFASLNDILLSMMQVVSGASDIPMTRLLGMSPAGLNATGQSDTRNYYDHVSTIQELEISPALGLFDELLITNALGSRPADIWYNWASLWQSTPSEQAEIGSKVAETISKLAATDLFDPNSLSIASVNVLVERGVLPGLDQNMGEVDEEEDESLSGFTDGIARPLYVSRRVLNVSDIRKWAEAQGITGLLDDLHVTIAYSKEIVDWMSIRPTWSAEVDGVMRIAAGGPRDMDVYNKGVVVLEFNDSDLTWRHEAIKEAGASWDWPDYQPHISITKDFVDLSKVKPYTGPIILGPEIFEEIK